MKRLHFLTLIAAIIYILTNFIQIISPDVDFKIIIIMHLLNIIWFSIQTVETDRNLALEKLWNWKIACRRRDRQERRAERKRIKKMLTGWK